MSRVEEVYIPALTDKKIPILTLDNKWHQLFTQRNSTKEIKVLENSINELLKRQGKLQTQVKEIKKLKAKLMDEIMSNMDTAETNQEVHKKQENNKRLISECNDKIDEFQDELMEIPKKISDMNQKLMIETMSVCYDIIQNDSKEIQEISEWISEIRNELKKKVIKKKEMEWVSQELYSYMHDIFGAEVINIFDMKYIGEKKKSLEDKNT